MPPRPPDDEKRKKLTQEALARLRAAREAIGPELLDSARQAIADSVAKEKAARGEKPLGEVKIDRANSMSAIIKFLELKAGDKGLRRRIQALVDRKRD